MKKRVMIPRRHPAAPRNFVVVGVNRDNIRAFIEVEPDDGRRSMTEEKE